MYGAAGGTTKTISMFSKIAAQTSQFVMEGVKNLVVKRHNLPVTSIVEELMEVCLPLWIVDEIRNVFCVGGNVSIEIIDNFESIVKYEFT